MTSVLSTPVCTESGCATTEPTTTVDPTMVRVFVDRYLFIAPVPYVRPVAVVPGAGTTVMSVIE